MAVRTTDDLVKAILTPGKDYRAGMPLTPCIAVATSLVDWIVANASTYKRTIPADLTTLEGYLAAWAYKMSDRQLQSSNAGRSSASFTGRSDLGLKSNSYGQAAILMDTSRMLAALDEGRIASAAWVGKAFSDLLPWVSRN